MFKYLVDWLDDRLNLYMDRRPSWPLQLSLSNYCNYLLIFLTDWIVWQYKQNKMIRQLNGSRVQSNDSKQSDSCLNGQRSAHFYTNWFVERLIFVQIVYLLIDWLFVQFLLVVHWLECESLYPLFWTVDRSSILLFNAVDHIIALFDYIGPFVLTNQLVFSFGHRLLFIQSSVSEFNRTVNWSTNWTVGLIKCVWSTVEQFCACSRKVVGWRVAWTVDTGMYSRPSRLVYCPMLTKYKMA